MSLLSRLERLQEFAAPSIHSLSDQELHDKLVSLTRLLLNDPGLPDDVRADVVADMEDQQAPCVGYDPVRNARDGRILAYVKADVRGAPSLLAP